jgi:flagellar hook-associated protein 3 FlgL
MISSLNANTQSFLAGLSNIQQRIAQANQQVTSGLKISQASDSPDQIGELLQLRANAAQNTQMQSNLNLELTNAQVADGALGSSIQLLDSATQIASEGANSTQTADTRATLAQQIQALMTQMVSISGTQVQGSYIFGGDTTQTAPYQLDLTAAKGVDQLSTTAATRLIQNPEGGTFQPALTAQQIFDDQNPDGTPTSSNVFNALNSLRTALLNNDSAGISTAQNLIKQSSIHLNDSEAFYGNVENQIQSASTYSATYATQLKGQISNIQDADVVSAAETLTQANTQLQAAMESQAKMPTTSLFNYLG